jgi:aminoglycoside phosphotransferase (APT) family kinase protein
MGRMVPDPSDIFMTKPAARIGHVGARTRLMVCARHGPAATLGPMITATGVRIGFFDLPAHVRAALESILGGAVVSAVSQPGGFSPGTADRVVTADGRRAFVKAVSPAQNEFAPALHRWETVVSGALPAGLPAPRLLGSFDDGEWVALVLADIDGRHPATPWQDAELSAVLTALDRLADALTPSPLVDLPTSAQRLADDFAGWHRLAADPPADLDPWAAAHLDDLVAAGDRGVDALTGDTLVHGDLRADNLLVRPDGSVVVVDWPWASIGAAWLDTVMFSINVRLFGGDAQRVLTDLAARTGTDPRDFTDVLAGAAGYFLDNARHPAPPGLPTVRGFQRAQGDALLPWLRERLASGDGS